MVKPKESQTCQQFSASNSLNWDLMGYLQLEQNYSLPYFTPGELTANLALHRQLNPDLHDLNTGGQPCTVAGLVNFLPLYENSSCPSGNPLLRNSKNAPFRRLGVSDMAIDASCAPGKRFLIFDRSGNHTRLFVSPSSPQNHIFASNTPASANGLCEKVASQLDQQFLLKPPVEEKWDENHLNDGVSEMLEDTEEINALLYSDGDNEYDDDDDDDSENDEVTSTGHTLFKIEDKDKLLDENMEEVASSDGSPKRQKLLDGSYKKSSLVSFENPMKLATSCNYENDVESCYGGTKTFFNDMNSSKRQKKVKIHKAMKILGSIIPGLNSKDPLSILEKAIVYLERKKIEAETLGLSDLDLESATSEQELLDQ